MIKYISAIVICSILVGIVQAQDRCIQCNSSLNLNCLINPGAFQDQQCQPTQILAPGCFTRVDGQHVTRGCLNALTQTDIENCNLATFPNCQTCVTGAVPAPVCNILSPFPQNRLACHHCIGGLDSDCAADQSTRTAIACPLFVDGDQCFIRRQSNMIQRGCNSTISTTQLCSGANAHHCFGCNTSGCNTHAQASTLIPNAPGSAAIHQLSFVALASVIVAAISKFY